MKKLLIALAAVMVTVASYGQGTVYLSNLGGGVNAAVTVAGSNPTVGVGPSWTAQLAVVNGTSVTPLTPVSTFRPAGTGAQAIADRYTVSPAPEVAVPGVPAGGTANLALLAWQTSFGSYEAAKAAGAAGASAPISVTLGGGNLPAANLIGLQAFSVTVVPEPSVIALGLLGVGALALRRRK